jgi:ribosomal protein S27E
MKTQCPLCGQKTFVYFFNRDTVKIICGKCGNFIGKTKNYKAFVNRNKQPES